MSFREFTAHILSTRDYEKAHLKDLVIADIAAYLNRINAGIGSEKGFSLIMLEDGEAVFSKLKGYGGYGGVMIKSPHYIGLALSSESREADFFGAYYMQSVVKKLYDMSLGSCWINIREISYGLKLELLGNNGVDMNYLLAFGLADEKAIKHKAPHNTVTNEASPFKQNPYGMKVYKAEPTDKSRYSIGDIVYLNEWGRHAAYEDLENRGMEEIFFNVRNAPSYKNLQPCRLILKDGAVELAVVNPDDPENYTDAGIMMYTLEGLAKDLGIPGEWHFAGDGFKNNEYAIVARIKL